MAHFGTAASYSTTLLYSTLAQQPPCKGGLTQLHTRMCCNRKKRNHKHCKNKEEEICPLLL